MALFLLRCGGWRKSYNGWEGGAYRAVAPRLFQLQFDLSIPNNTQ